MNSLSLLDTDRYSVVLNPKSSSGYDNLSNTFLKKNLSRKILLKK